MANELPPGKTMVVDEVNHTSMSRETAVMEATKRRRTAAVCEVDCHRPMAIEAKVVSAAGDKSSTVDTGGLLEPRYLLPRGSCRCTVPSRI